MASSGDVLVSRIDTKARDMERWRGEIGCGESGAWELVVLEGRRSRRGGTRAILRLGVDCEL